ncbi:MAG: hypothetical protein U0231_09575 [Nitrospiraceae bacterium]
MTPPFDDVAYPASCRPRKLEELKHPRAHTIEHLPKSFAVADSRRLQFFGMLPRMQQEADAVACIGLLTMSRNPPIPVGTPRRAGRFKTRSAASGMPSSKDVPPVMTTPAPSIPRIRPAQFHV